MKSVRMRIEHSTHPEFKYIAYSVPGDMPRQIAKRGNTPEEIGSWIVLAEKAANNSGVELLITDEIGLF
jgi:hypothetical protein